MLEYTDDEQRMKFLYTMEELPPEIILCRLSLDKEVLAMQTAENSVTILDFACHRKWTLQPRLGEDAAILPNGILWSDHGGNSQDLILVTSKGLELYKVSAKKNICKLSRSITIPISNFWYNPDYRMILTASQNQPVKRFLGGTTPVAKDTLQLDGFFLNVDKPNMPSLELPPPDRISRLELGPGVDSNHIYLVHVYGLLLTLVQYTAEECGYVTVYHVTKSSMETMATLSLGYVPQQILKISTYDNLFLFHDVSKKITIAFDLMKPPRKTTGSATGVIDPVIQPIIATFAYVPKEDAQVYGSSPSRIRAKPVAGSCNFPTVNHIHSLKFTGLGNLQQQKISHLPSPLCKGFVEVENHLEAHPFYSPVVFEIHISGWAYDRERRIMWKIECNPYHTAQRISDPWERMFFLYRWGKVLHWIGEDPSPVAASIEYSSMMGIISTFQIIHQALIHRVQDHELMAIFRALHIPYWNEIQRIQWLTGAGSAFRRGDSDLDDSLLVPIYHKPEFFANSTTNIVKLAKSPSSDRASQRISLRALRRPLRESLTRLRNSDNPIEMVLDLPEPLEPNGTSQLFLPDISVIGIKVRNIALSNFQSEKKHSAEIDDSDSASTIEGIEFLGVRSPSPPIINLAFEQKPILIRRDEKGDLIVNQHDMLAYIWLPLLSAEANQVPFDYYADCLSTYITALAEMDLEVISAVNILHATLMFYLGRFHELCNLLRNSFYNDSSELALMLLQFAGILEDEIKSNEYVLKYSTILMRMSEPTYRYHLETWSELLQRQSLDMLWRGGDKVTTVKWLLTQCRVTDAVALCLPKSDRWDDILRPGCIPGSEFFLSAVNLLKAQQVLSVNEAENLRKERNAQMFYNLHYFLTIWDPRCLLPDNELGAEISPLCSHAPFPVQAFEETVERDLRRLYGYSK
jgi:hypothetical protein